MKIKKSFKKPLAIVSAVILLLAAADIGGAFYMLGFALKPEAKAAQKEARTDSFMYATYPFLRQWEDSLSRNNAVKNAELTNDEGLKLHAIYFSAPRPTRKSAVIVHGYTDNARRMMMIAYLYNHDLGYNVLLPDLQHHGQSQGEAITMGWKDHYDLVRWIAVADSLFGGNTEMALHGISMGAATVMMASGENLRPCVKAFVEDCGYTSAWDEFEWQLGEMFSLPAFPLLYTTSALCRLKYGWTFGEASALEQVRKCRRPMLFIHGGADTYVPTRMVHELYAAKPGVKELWIPAGVEHAQSYKDCRAEYTRRVATFLEKYNK